MVAGEFFGDQDDGFVHPRWYVGSGRFSPEVARRDGLGPLCVSPPNSPMHQQRPHLVQSLRACQPRASGIHLLVGHQDGVQVRGVPTGRAWPDPSRDDRHALLDPLVAATATTTRCRSTGPRATGSAARAVPPTGVVHERVDQVEAVGSPSLTSGRRRNRQTSAAMTRSARKASQIGPMRPCSGPSPKADARCVCKAASRSPRFAAALPGRPLLGNPLQHPETGFRRGPPTASDRGPSPALYRPAASTGNIHSSDRRVF